VPGFDVPVNAVEADVELAADVPLRVRRLPLQELVEGLEPGNALAPLRLPEVLEAALVDVRLRVRLAGELGIRRVTPLLEEHGLDRLLLRGLSRHWLPPFAAASGTRAASGTVDDPREANPRVP